MRTGHATPAVRWSLLLALALGTALPACSGGPDGDGDADVDADSDSDSDSDGDGDGDQDQVDPVWYEPDPEGRTTEGDIRGAAPEMVIVTNEELETSWQGYANLRNRAGTHTNVVLVSSIVGAHGGVDDAEDLRNYLRDAHANGLRFALLGGDAEVVPFRRIVDEVSVPMQAAYDTNGPSELYFADLDSSWDADGDGSFGESDEDITLDQLRAAEIAVGRVPASTAAEVDAYARKVEAYETAPGGRETYPLLTSDVASTLPLIGDIDAAVAVERTVSEFFPEQFVANALRLYATEQAASDYGGEVVTQRRIRAAWYEGYPLTFHNGHGSWYFMSDDIDRDFVVDLSNDLPTVMLSCACLSGNFADIAETPTADGWSTQGPDDDSAGELFIVGSGGGVAYVGNTAIGLGPIGGSQFLHSMFEAIFVSGIDRIGEAMNAARPRMRGVSFNFFGVPMRMSDDTERWTQLIVILLGDPALRPWTATGRGLALEAPEQYGPGWNEIQVRVTDLAGGAPVAGATVVLDKPDDFLIRATTDDSGTAVFRLIPYGPSEMTVTASGQGMIRVTRTIVPTL